MYFRKVNNKNQCIFGAILTFFVCFYFCVEKGSIVMHGHFLLEKSSVYTQASWTSKQQLFS
jgi:hypothetical protein